jgi:dolichol-phosphate mannosyltransferase
LLAVLAALLLLTELNQPLLDPDEGRQAEIPREMLVAHDLLRPRMLGQPYYEKPPLQYWLTAGAYSLFGTRPAIARLVPALAAWFTVLATYAWARRALGSRPAFLGALGLCLTGGFVVAGRTIVLDSLLTACVAASWYAAHRAVSDVVLRWRWWLGSALVCGLGVLGKGPVAVALLLPPVVAYQLLNVKRMKDEGGMMNQSASATSFILHPSSFFLAWGIYLSLALLVAAPWYVAMALSEPDFLAHFLWKANVIRFVNAYDHEQPWWFYLPVVLGFSFPWSLLWPALGYFLFSRGQGLARLRSPGLGFCVLASGWCIGFFSLSGCKSPLYITPAFPPLALLLGACLDAILFHPATSSHACLEHARRRLPYWSTLLLLNAAAAGCLASVLLDWQARVLTSAPMLFFLMLAVAWWRWGKSLSPAITWAACALATGLLFIIPARDLLAGYTARHSPAFIAYLGRRAMGDNECPVVSYARQWPSASFYFRRDLIPSFDDECRQSLVEFLSKTPETLVIVDNGPPLHDLLGALPDSLTTEICLPRRRGQAALLRVGQRSLLEVDGQTDKPAEIRDATVAP